MNEMTYRHQFRVAAAPERVAEFHSRSANMAAITPPPIRIHVRGAPEILGNGDLMDFTMWLGPLPVRWIAQMDQVNGLGFRDRQLRGPFGAWTHVHSFAPAASGETDVIDEVTVRLRRHPLWGPVGLAMWLGLPLLFAYRGWKTRRLLQ